MASIQLRILVNFSWELNFGHDDDCHQENSKNNYYYNNNNNNSNTNEQTVTVHWSNEDGIENKMKSA